VLGTHVEVESISGFPNELVCLVRGLDALHPMDLRERCKRALRISQRGKFAVAPRGLGEA